MKVTILGAGPAGLYLAILLQKAGAGHTITVLERNARDVTFGWGVVFSDETLGNLLAADPDTHVEIARTFAHWDAIDTHYRGACIRSAGHGFSGIARQKLLSILQRRAADLGIDVQYGHEVTDVEALARSSDLLVGADGVKSLVRTQWEASFRPSIDLRNCRYIWLGTHKRFDAFTFLFETNAHGVFQVHAYRFDEASSTFIVECDEASWRAAGLDHASVDESVAYCETLFAKHLDGHRLLSGRSTWGRFPTVKNASWQHEGRVVLIGDAAHTAHFSIGSGTKMAIEDAIALAGSLATHPHDVRAALTQYETARRPVVERTQKAAQDSLSWFEHVKRYDGMDPVPFTFGLLSRSTKVTYENLARRDAGYAAEVRAWFGTHTATTGVARAPSERAALEGGGTAVDPASVPPPMFTPFTMRGLTLPNRVVLSPMCMYSATDGTPDDFHMVHLGSHAMGGAGLICTEMTDVSADGRITPGCTGMYTAAHVEAWRRIVQFITTRTSSKTCLQLGHAGRKGSTRLMWDGMDEPLPSGNWPLISASPIPYFAHSQVPREMDRDDMDRVRDAFVLAARRADEAGFDMIELHMAHGYLLASFLSPLTNQRRDEHGGPIAQRMRFPLEVFDAVRAAWPAAKPISVRISATDWLPGGITDEDVVVVARTLREHGVDVMDISTGQTTPASKPAFYGRMYQAPWSDLVRNEAGVPTMTVGNIASADQCNTLLASLRADLCVVARGHLWDPFFTLHVASEQGYTAQPWPVQYTAGRR